ncbi:hypothetical protein NDU88_001258 [Pleurodeles waltl]|uniref:Uncharacterized protein n=1 Tax=Pleurodeles waltl TaxID=8319 RepID=A0AAV7P4W4_PLEWA|nr:hypothetical protein NDU88_001258 [Pleurodeles waltl]
MRVRQLAHQLSISISHECRKSTVREKSGDARVDGGLGQRRAPAHPVKSWVETTTSTLLCCPLRVSRPRRGESDLLPHRDPIRVAKRSAATRLSNKPGRPGPSRGYPERPPRRARARWPLRHRSTQVVC